MDILLIDNYDSYTFNLFHLILAQNKGKRPFVVKNDDPFLLSLEESLDSYLAETFDAIVISPGPGTPARCADFGLVNTAAIAAGKQTPLLGVCLGHQGIGLDFGMQVDLAPEPVHGRTSLVYHYPHAGMHSIFEGIQSPFSAVRYHSLHVFGESESLAVTARTCDGIIMGLQHRTFPIFGVQFHPESIASEGGARLMSNFLQLASASCPNNPSEREYPVFTTLFPRHKIELPSPENGAPILYALAMDVEALGSIGALAVFSCLFGSADSSVFRSLASPSYHLGGSSFLMAGDSDNHPLANYFYRQYYNTIKDHLGDVESLPDGTDLIAWFREKSALQEPQIVQMGECNENLKEKLSLYGFFGGWFLLFSYEMHKETMYWPEYTYKSRSTNDYDAILVHLDRFVIFDGNLGRVYICHLSHSNVHDDSWLLEIQQKLASNLHTKMTDLLKFVNCIGENPKDPTTVLYGSSLLRDKEIYINKVMKCKEKIKLGESYELCLTRQWPVFDATLFDSCSLGVSRAFLFYATVLIKSPSPFSTFLFLKKRSFGMVGASPEEFLRVSPFQTEKSFLKARMRPIKGTCRRDHSDPVNDANLASSLATSVKDLSENLMV